MVVVLIPSLQKNGRPILRACPMLPLNIRAFIGLLRRAKKRARRYSGYSPFSCQRAKPRSGYTLFNLFLILFPPFLLGQVHQCRH